MAKQHYQPKPLFDSISLVCDLYQSGQQSNTQAVITNWLKQCLNVTQTSLPAYAVTDFQQVLNFLYTYRGSDDTFNAYRRELERLIQWSWFIHGKSLFSLKRLDIEAFVEFSQNPHKRWIGIKIVSRFIDKDGLRVANPQWRPFIVKISKKAHQDGRMVEKSAFFLSQASIKALFAVLGSFYSFLIQEEITESNPLLQLRQKSKFIRKTATASPIRRLSDIQWQTVIQSTKTLADHHPAEHERTLFIMQALYSMYLRISELTATTRWTPKMHHFFRDTNQHWWFKTVGKGNKERWVAVSDTMLDAMKRWREYLGLSALPTPDDESPLLPRQKGKGGMKSTRTIRNIVQLCFNTAVEQLREQKLLDEAEMLRSATVHWLRHTGISDDVKRRPREHVRDDAGHSSGAITDKYIDVDLRERANSAKNKEKQI